MIITCFNVGSVVSLLTCFPQMIIDRQSLAVKSTLSQRFLASILSITFLIFLRIPFGFSTATVTPMHLPFRYNSTLFVREQIIASNYELYNLQSTFQRFLYTLLNEKFISLFPLFSSLFSSLFLKFLANQRQDKYSLAHAHSTDALIHTYGQYGCSAFSAVYTDAINQQY